MAEDKKHTDVGKMSRDVELAVDFVRAAGGEVSAEVVEILERVEREEIDSDEAMRLIGQLHRGD